MKHLRKGQKHGVIDLSIFCVFVSLKFKQTDKTVEKNRLGFSIQRHNSSQVASTIYSTSNESASEKITFRSKGDLKERNGSLRSFLQEWSLIMHGLCVISQTISLRRRTRADQKESWSINGCLGFSYGRWSLIRPKKKNALVTVSRPTLTFWADPKL